MPGYRDGKGSIVFEWEMDRIRSEVDEGIPDQNSFKTRENQNILKKRGDVLELAEYIKVGLARTFNDYKFEVIFAHLAPIVYRMAFAKAVNDLKLWDRVCLLDFRSMLTGVVARNIFRYWLINGKQERGILDIKFLHKLARAETFENCYPEVQFWNYEAYHQDWEPLVHDVVYRGPMMTTRCCMRDVDINQPEEHLRYWYNVPPNLRKATTKPLWGNEIDIDLFD
jgi:hypothetical protein